MGFNNITSFMRFSEWLYTTHREYIDDFMGWLINKHPEHPSKGVTDFVSIQKLDEQKAMFEKFKAEHHLKGHRENKEVSFDE